MPDIFISYSRKDSAQAEQLAELLASAGLECWIDKSGIDLATSWSREIVQAIDSCKAFAVLLSRNSVSSHNVAKEVSLAAEEQKKILPIDIEPVPLSEDLRYHLAGLQRSPISNIDAILRALDKLGLEATSAPSVQLVKETDGKKSLMILPFEDLSPTGDNAWFADGIVSELISALSNIKSLRIMDAQTTKEFKSYKGHLTTYAKEMAIRYFVQGDVRKFGDQIKVTARLLDIETGEHLWQDALRGKMDDIFELQETVAQNVVEGLKLNLSQDEKQKLTERGTENAEAYELFLKANEYFLRQTRIGFQHAIQLFSEAIKLDPGYATAYSSKANALSGIYRSYDRNPELLLEAESLCKEALRLKPDLFSVYGPLSTVYMLQGKLAEAEQAAREYILKEPDTHKSHFSLGFFYGNTGQPDKAIAPYEEAVRLKPDERASLFNLVIACNVANEGEKCAAWAKVALPLYERHLKLHPDEESSRMACALLLFFSGRTEDAHTIAITLQNAKDGFTLFNTAALLGQLGKKQDALKTFRKAIEAGFKNTRVLNDFLTDDDEGILALAGTPEYEDIKRMIEKLSEP